MKKLLVMVILVGLVFFLPLWTSPVFSMGGDGFTLNIIQDGYQVKEISRIVSLPFYSEYQVRLKNTHNRRATARVFIDGIPISKLGDIVISPNGQIDLERFLDRSLNEGKRFKFVPIDHPEVDDLYNKENGKIKVEFRLEKKYEFPIYIIPQKEQWRDNPFHPFSYENNEFKLLDSFSSINCSINVTSTSSDGATIGGNKSYQRFREISLDMEEKIFIVELKIIGI